MKLNEIIKWNDTSSFISFIPNVFNKQKLDPNDLEGVLLTHSVWVDYETLGTTQIREL